eukprot:TRINITY_DN2005_c0_g1_i1.p1 TRINITY_DN2005_c0_g1~~TRINITY_DN2005_c0_g1_i1.p1  ORF type:complete len:263 (-),score=76.35 TRINITY_DN2005_c0_g1_i1:139-927(-)
MAVSLTCGLVVVNSIMKLIFSVTILFFAFKYFGVSNHPLCDDLKALLGSQENQERFFGRWSHAIISYVALFSIFAQALVAGCNVFSSLRNDENLSDNPLDTIPGKSVENAIFLPVGSVFLTWFIGVTHDKCHGIGLNPGGQWLISFTNSSYDFIFWALVALMLCAPVVAILDAVVNRQKSGGLTMVAYIATIIGCIIFGGYVTFYGFRFAISYAFYAKSLALQWVFAASLIIGIINLGFYINRIVQKVRVTQTRSDIEQTLR